MAKAVRWDAILNPRRFSQGAQVVERDATRMGRRIRDVERSNVRFSASAGRLGGVAIRAFGGATVAAGGLAVAGAVLGLKTAASLETAEVAFSRLLGSGKKARSFLGELKSFAARTPFELPGLVDASRALVGAGTAAKNVIPTLTALGDASGALGLDQERFGRVMIAVTQIMNRGKVQAEELNQITEAGIPVWTLLAKATGKPVPELQKLMQAGKLLAKDTLPLLFAQMRKDYGGGMIAQSKTLAGVWSTVKDTISLTLSDALKPLLPMLKTALPQAAEFFQRSVEGITGFFRDDLGPELDRVKTAWDENRTSILGFVGSLTGSQSSMGASADAATALADSLVKLTEAAGAAARGGDQISAWLNEQHRQLDISGEKIKDKLIAPLTSTVAKFGELFGLRPIGPLEGVAERLTSTTAELAGNTTRAASAAQQHATAMRQQKSAMDALSGSLDDEKNAELNLRQAKLNVSTAQGRLNELKKAGKTRSTEYRQAQLNLERAHLAAQEASTLYRSAVNKSNEAERLAAARATATKGALDKLKATSIGAAKQITQFGLDASAAFKKLKSKTVSVTANYNIGAPKGIELLIEKGLVRRASGGPIAGPGTATSDSIPAMLSKGEHVWSAREVQGAGGHAAVEQMRRQARGFAAGGPVLKFAQHGADAFIKRPGRFDANIARSLDLAARGFSALVRQNKDAIFGLGKAAVKRFIQSTDPLPYIWGGAGPGGYDCSGLVSAVLGKHTGRGGGHGQRYFTTSSIRSGILGIKPGGGGTLEIGVTAGTGHMAGKYGGLGFEARSTRSGIIVGAGVRSPGSFARQFHLAKGGAIDRDLLERFAQLTGADIGGDQGRLRVNGMAFAKGGYLNPRTFSYAKHLLQRIRSGARVYEDFTWRGMPRSYGRWNDEVQRRVFANLTGGYDFPRDLKKVGPILGSLIHRSAYRARAGGGGAPRSPFAAALANALRRGSTIFEDLSWYGMGRFSDRERFGLERQWGLAQAWKADHWNQRQLLGMLQVRGYDQGGWLMPGATLAINRTGRPERVGGGGGVTVALHFHGPVVGGRQGAEELAELVQTELLKRKRRQGGLALGLS